MFTIEILFLFFSLFAVALFFASGFKNTVLLYTGTGLLLPFFIITPFFEYYASIIMRVIVPFLLIIPAFYDGLVLSKDKAEEKYFGFLSIGTIVIFVLLILSWWRAGNYADILWGVLLITLAIFTLVCEKITDKTHKKIFLALGTITFLTWISGIFLHPIMANADFSMANIMLSLKGNIGFFIFPTMFFLGNYSKMGLLHNQDIHKKVFLYFGAMFAISIFIRNPELTPFIDKIPILGDKLPELSAGVTLISMPLVGLWAKNQNKHNQH